MDFLSIMRHDSLRRGVGRAARERAMEEGGAALIEGPTGNQSVTGENNTTSLSFPIA